MSIEMTRHEVIRIGRKIAGLRKYPMNHEKNLKKYDRSTITKKSEKLFFYLLTEFEASQNRWIQSGFWETLPKEKHVWNSDRTQRRTTFKSD
jgi:hypothetical protein